MAPAMLKNSKAWSPGRQARLGKPNGKLRLSHGRNDRKRDWNVLRTRHQAIEACTRRYRIVITPPQRCQSFRSSPAVELID
jgi:hypothetical protein